MAANKPEKVIRMGTVSASIFANEIEREGGAARTVRSVTMQKRYKDGDEFKYSSSFNLAELPLAVRVLQLAQEFVERHEAEIEISD